MVLLVLENNRKTKDNDPDLVLYIAPTLNPEVREQEKAAPVATEDDLPFQNWPGGNTPAYIFPQNSTAAGESKMNKTKKDQVTAEMKTAIPLFVAGNSDSDIAKRTGRSRWTVAKWRENEEFLAMVEQARTEVVDRALNRLMTTATDAVAALATLCKDRNKKLKLASATKVMDLILEVRKLRDIESRLDLLEKLALKEHGRG